MINLYLNDKYVGEMTDKEIFFKEKKLDSHKSYWYIPVNNPKTRKNILKHFKHLDTATLTIDAVSYGEKMSGDVIIDNSFGEFVLMGTGDLTVNE